MVEQVYDASFRQLSMIMTRPMRSSHRAKLFHVFRSLKPEVQSLVQDFVAEAIDRTFIEFLHLFEVYNTPLPFRSSSGEIVDMVEVSDGLAGEPYNEDGWIARFSKYKNGFQEAPELDGGESP